MALAVVPMPVEVRVAVPAAADDHAGAAVIVVIGAATWIVVVAAAAIIVVVGGADADAQRADAEANLRHGGRRRDEHRRRSERERKFLHAYSPLVHFPRSWFRGRNA